MKLYRQVIKYCKEKFPLPHPVSVRRLKMRDTFDGNCCLKKEGFLIRINRKLPEHIAIETFLHEYAHLMAWDLCQKEYHCNEWGKAYSKVYRAFLKEFEM